MAVDRHLLLEFFLTFARFEYALKASGFHKRHPQNPPTGYPASPDWDRFAESLRDTFNPDVRDKLTQACTYLQDSPPSRQLIVGEEVVWETATRLGNEPKLDFLLRMVRRVRNNLFHGGKHNLKPHEDVGRTELLLKSSLEVLGECLKVAPEQGSAYEQAHL